MRGVLLFLQYVEDCFLYGTAANEALRLGHPPLLVSPAGFAVSSCTSLREIPQSQRLTRGLFAILRIFVRSQ